MRFSLADAGLHPFPVCLSYLVFLGLVSCARADPPEMFVADPALQDDFTSNLPATGASMGFEYAIVQGIAVYEGDILLGRVNSSGMLAERFKARGVGKSDAFNRWPDGIVVYDTPTNSSPAQQENIKLAIEHWTEHTNMSFVERTRDNEDIYPHYIRFMDTQSCASHVGMIGNEQPVYLSDACSVGSVIHELGHAIGLFHEHTRSDRDNFVQINWSEIRNGKDINFNLQTAGVDTYSPYDYDSIMHYGRDFFSNSGEPTIVVPDDIEIGQREALSELDIQSVNNMYETDLAIAPITSQIVGGDLELDIATYNYGDLGAHGVELILRLGNDAEWKGVSENSGWDCLSYGPDLNCVRNSFREQTESRFTVLVAANSASAEDLQARIISRTQDKDESNNGHNDAGVEWESEGVNLAAALPENTMPTIAESEPESSSDPLESEAKPRSSEPVAAVSDDSAGGGSSSLSMLAVLVSMLGIRRRRKH